MDEGGREFPREFPISLTMMGRGRFRIVMILIDTETRLESVVEMGRDDLKELAEEAGSKLGSRLPRMVDWLLKEIEKRTGEGATSKDT